MDRIVLVFTLNKMTLISTYCIRILSDTFGIDCYSIHVIMHIYDETIWIFDTDMIDQVSDNDEQRRSDEFAALSSIYGDDGIFTVESVNRLRIVIDDVLLIVTIPDDYPSQSPPMYELSAPMLDARAKAVVGDRLQQIYVDNIGEPLLFLWIHAIKDMINGTGDDGAVGQQSTNTDQQQSSSNLESTGADASIVIYSGATLTDRKSTFQAHLARITSKDEVS